MNRNQIRILHKWIFVFMGIFMLAWIISGLLMILPQWWFGSITRFDRSDVDYTRAILSPSQAIASIEQQSTEPVEVKSISLRTVDNRILYELDLGNNNARLIDAQNGKKFSITPDVAERVARRNFEISAPLLESKRLTEHDSTYPAGRLPVYRIRFNDKPDVFYIMQENNLRIFRSTPLSRLRGTVVSLHDLGPIEFLSGSPDLRHNTLIFTAVLSLFGTIAGVILTLPRRKTTNR